MGLQLLRARLVLPLSRPAISDGGVLLKGSRIVAVGPWRRLQRSGAARTLDLGDSVILPGLINAHCHLDYTDMAGMLPPPRLFTDWLKLMVTTKGGCTVEDYAAAWTRGAEMLVRTGTTTVADIEAVPELLPAVWRSTPLRVVSLVEMLAITGRRTAGEVLETTLRKLGTLKHPRNWAGLSPHAPYSTLPDLLALCAKAVQRRHLPVCTHIAESQLEFQMFRGARGEMYHWLKRSGREMSDCGQSSPVRHVERAGLLTRHMMAAHVNYLAKGDLGLLARNEVSVVHCPRSHAYFKHEKFPLRSLRRAGVNVCLGTDSLVSVYKTRRQTVELDMFEEMRALAAAEPDLSPKEILRMVTLNGARALGRSGLLGELTPGGFADLIAIPFSGRRAEVYDALLNHKGPVSASMIHGAWAVRPATQRSRSKHPPAVA